MAKNTDSCMIRFEGADVAQAFRLALLAAFHSLPTLAHQTESARARLRGELGGTPRAADGQQLSNAHPTDDALIGRDGESNSGQAQQSGSLGEEEQKALPASHVQPGSRRTDR